MTATTVNIFYLIAAVMFIVGIQLLGSPKTAPRGNQLAAVGMLIAIVVTFFIGEMLDFQVIVAGMVVGGGLGAMLALRIRMTAMPQMVALLNGFGGAASALVASVELLRHTQAGTQPGLVVLTAIALAALIGGVTLTGSLIAWAKLEEVMRGTPITYPMQNAGNAVIGAAALVLAVTVVAAHPAAGAYWALFALAHLLGVLLVIPIGGADMPVVISLLNSYSGLAACAAGFILGNSALVISGSLVGTAGIILSKIMCEAMNRSLVNVLFGAVGGAVADGGGPQGGPQGAVKGFTPEDAAIVFGAARQVVVVPGYGMAVAQAQHAVRELADTLEERGVDVKYAIHPVAGRMPGHMNVLLAEANVPYDKLLEMDAINPQFAETDVSLVIGANDVVNPAARTQAGSPIYGMPILDVDRSKHVMVIKRSMNPGFAGVENPLFYNDNTMMIFGDAKATVLKLVEAVRAS